MSLALFKGAVVSAAAALLVTSTGGTAYADDPVNCKPAVTDGRMVTPGFWNGLGAQALIWGLWECDSQGGDASFTMSGTVYDYFIENGSYRTVRSWSQTVGSNEGAAVLSPSAVATYAPRSNQVNTWHYTRFVATTSFGASVDVTGQLFYVTAPLQ